MDVLVYTITVEPVPAPFITPVVAFTDTMDELALLHEPGVVRSYNVVDDPRQISVVPVIGAGMALTVSVRVMEQLVGAW